MAAIPSPPGPQNAGLGQVVLFQAADGQVLLDGRTPRKPRVFREGESWLLVRQAAWNWLESTKTHQGSGGFRHQSPSDSHRRGCCAERTF